jgi:soluble lytic murein transglycosylase-like protein
MKAFVLCLAALPAFAGEYAVLASGFRIHADRHEKAGGVIQLFNAHGVTELPASEVVRFETEEYAPPEAGPAPASAAAKSDAAGAPSPEELVRSAAQRAVIPPELVHSVAKAESALRQDAISHKGAIGIMQLMPATAAALSADPRDPKQNTEAGAMYLRELLERYDGDVAKALAAYNAGPGAVDKYKGVPPYRETRAYVNRVIRDYKRRVGEVD